MDAIGVKFIRCILFKAKWAVLLLLLFIVAAHAQKHSSAEISTVQRNAWIDKTTNMLNSFKPTPDTDSVTVTVRHVDGRTRIECKVKKQGILRFSERKWIYFFTNSSHDDKQVGDITLAVDHHGRIYRNEGHVCGGIIFFRTDSVDELRDGKTFFRYFNSEIDSARWQTQW